MKDLQILFFKKIMISQSNALIFKVNVHETENKIFKIYAILWHYVN